MDYRQRARLNQDKSMRIKHMAFAVKVLIKPYLIFSHFYQYLKKLKKLYGKKLIQKLQFFLLMTLSSNFASH